MEKIKGNVFGLLIIHNDRAKEDPEHKRDHDNPNIQEDKTHLNYDLINRENPYQYYKNRLEELDKERLEQTGQHLRKDAVKAFSLIVYLPEEKENAGERYEREFFKGCLDYAYSQFGEDNIIQAVVHKDENRPHIHIIGIPTTREPDRQGREYERVSYKDAFTREDYRNMHPLLQEHCRKRTHDRTLKVYDEDRAKRKTMDKETYIKLKEDERTKEFEREQAKKDKELLKQAEKECGHIKKGFMGTISKEEIERYEGLLYNVVNAANREIKRAETERDKAIYEKENCYSLRELELKDRCENLARENKTLEREAKENERDSRFVKYMRENYNVKDIEKDFNRQEKQHTRTHEKDRER